MDQNVRVRFAPSPTGPLHIGGLRTALFNYLFAKNHGGKFLLRIEDTDQTRFVEGAEEYIKESLAWLGIQADESPWNGGDFGPYRQSERKELYAAYAQQLIDAGHAYYAFDTPEELEAMRQRLQEANVDNQQYNAITRTTMKNSLTMPEQEVKEWLASGKPYVVRLKVPKKEEIRIHDMVRDWVLFHAFTLEDKIILKSDGMPTYHLANVVDDHLMKITHVIRGEEWLPSSPIHVLLYRFLGWEDTMPKFAHLPLLLNPNGKGKLSKRQGDKMGFSVFPLNWKDPDSDHVVSGYREQGYLADAFTNFLALLGWSPGTEQEIFSLGELIEAFSMERVGKSGTKFDIDKAKWYNEQYLRAFSATQMQSAVMEVTQEQGIPCTEDKALAIGQLMQERITFPSDIWKDASYFFQAPTSYDEKVVRKKWNDDAKNVLAAYREAIQELDSFTAMEAKATLVEVIEAQGLKMGKVMQAVRMSITGVAGGPDLMGIFETLGPKEVAARIDLALAALD